MFQDTQSTVCTIVALNVFIMLAIVALYLFFSNALRRANREIASLHVKLARATKNSREYAIMGDEVMHVEKENNTVPMPAIQANGKYGDWRDTATADAR